MGSYQRSLGSVSLVGLGCVPLLALGQAGSGGTFVSAISANPVSLFPLTNTDQISQNVADSFFETLAERHWDTYEWAPKIATKWEIAPDGKQFTFWIDKRARFSDGSPVTAEDVKFSYEIIFRKGVDSTALKPYYAAIDKVDVLAPDQVRFAVKDLYYKNFDVVAGLTVFSKKHYESLYKKDNTLSKAEVTRSPLGTGMWLLDKWDDNQQLVLKRNADYWDKERLQKEGRWNADRYVYKIIAEDAVELEALKKGDLTYAGLTPKQWQLQTDGPEFKDKVTKVKTTNKAAVGYGFIGWNMRNPVLENKDVRWALSHLMNLPFWIDKFDFGMSEPTVGPYSVKSDEHDPAVKPVPFDPRAARKRLASAGWKTAGKDGFLVKDGKKLEVTIIYPTQAKESIEPRLVEYKNQAAKVGVALQLKAVEWTSFLKLLDDHKFDGVALAWTRDIDQDLKQIWHSSSIADKGSNFIGYANPEVDKLIDEHRQTLDRTKRMELARRIQKLIYEDQPYSFMTERKFTLYGHQSSVKKPKDTFNYSIGTSFWKLPQAAP